jgi:flagellar biosynthesis protein FlhF
MTQTQHENNPMDMKTYRAASMREALAVVRRELGPDAAVLHTREVRGRGLLGWLRRDRQIEITASASVQVPSRLPERLHRPLPVVAATVVPATAPAHLEADNRAQFRADLKQCSGRQAGLIPSRPEADPRASLLQKDVKGQLDELQAIVEDLCQRTIRPPDRDLPEALFFVFTDMIEAEVEEEVARQLIDAVRAGADPAELTDPAMVRSRIMQRLEAEIAATGPIRVTPGQRSVVALVGPTGVGKTTTVAKLAANFRLRERRRVGLITVDTYRIAAVEQLRTYADIIDLPMEVVSTPREMREATARLADLDLVLVDTAGRSPRDEVRIQELKSMLAEAKPNEVHLVLSSVAGARNLVTTAEKFAAVGVTSLTLTKLDETTGLGHLLTLLRKVRLPVSYLTNGQNVPDDICVATGHELARMLLATDR